MSNIVAIVGRPNVGKSTLFNRLVQRRDAIVDSVAGVTRDRHYGRGDWNGKEFSIIDTGGYVDGSEDIFEGEIRRQVKLALDEASAIIFMVDLQSGITDFDKEIADLLRRTKKQILPEDLVVRLADHYGIEIEAVAVEKERETLEKKSSMTIGLFPWRKSRLASTTSQRGFTAGATRLNRTT